MDTGHLPIMNNHAIVDTVTSRIPVYQPFMAGNEKTYVNQCLDSGWISSKGEFIARFEKQFADYINVAHATSVCNGTVAIHLALMALDIRPGDEIIVPAFTYVASVNTIAQTGAVPVFVDSLASTWQIDSEQVRKKITSKTRAVMAVHLYGQSCDMAALSAICKQHNLLLIEDCAEAFGSYFDGQHVGTFGDIATFSFFGNKTITTGEGGMVVTKLADVHAKACLLKNQGVSLTRQYWHDVIGYNYRMTNISAAIGLAQLEQADLIIEKKRHIAKLYREGLCGLPLVTHDETAGTIHSFWMCSILVNDPDQRDPLRAHLEKAHIETRPLFYPANVFPMYDQDKEHYPIAESLGKRGINLPSWPGMSDTQINRIIESIRGFFN